MHRIANPTTTVRFRTIPPREKADRQEKEMIVKLDNEQGSRIYDGAMDVEYFTNVICTSRKGVEGVEYFKHPLNEEEDAKATRISFSVFEKGQKVCKYFLTEFVVYLCNDNGKTIEVLTPGN